MSPLRHRLPARERPDLELPAGGGLLVADDAEVGEGLELGDDFALRKDVGRVFAARTSRHEPEFELY